eukprot:COSAG02_NODE_1030_length_15077_cov_36.210119_7_plen_158_part_00
MAQMNILIVSHVPNRRGPPRETEGRWSDTAKPRHSMPATVSGDGHPYKWINCAVSQFLKLREGGESRPSSCGDDTGHASPTTQVQDANNHCDWVQDSVAPTHDLITSQTNHRSVEHAAGACTLSICRKDFYFSGPVEVALEALAQCCEKAQPPHPQH